MIGKMLKALSSVIGNTLQNAREFLVEDQSASKMRVSVHFTKEELQCPCCRLFEFTPGTIVKIEMIRRGYGKPMPINSGTRCKARNTKVGGSKTSFHMKSLAIDVECSSSYDKFDLVREAIAKKANGIVVYDWGIHIDFGDRPRNMLKKG